MESECSKVKSYNSILLAFWTILHIKNSELGSPKTFIFDPESPQPCDDLGMRMGWVFLSLILFFCIFFVCLFLYVFLFYFLNVVLLHILFLLSTVDFCKLPHLVDHSWHLERQYPLLAHTFIQS
uniref:Uncharacterized protein n=1 Tax=Oryzias melastigma TaxID=30732 RepID=A0A3B3BLX3_ORYME